MELNVRNRADLWRMSLAGSRTRIGQVHGGMNLSKAMNFAFLTVQNHAFRS